MATAPTLVEHLNPIDTVEDLWNFPPGRQKTSVPAACGFAKHLETALTIKRQGAIVGQASRKPDWQNSGGTALELDLVRVEHRPVRPDATPVPASRPPTTRPTALLKLVLISGY